MTVPVSFDVTPETVMDDPDFVHLPTSSVTSLLEEMCWTVPRPQLNVPVVTLAAFHDHTSMITLPAIDLLTLVAENAIDPPYKLMKICTVPEAVAAS